MADPKGTRRNAAPRTAEKKEAASSLTPANPLSGRQALLQMGILFGVPLLLLLVARFVLKNFFPSLGY